MNFYNMEAILGIFDNESHDYRYLTDYVRALRFVYNKLAVDEPLHSQIKQTLDLCPDEGFTYTYLSNLTDEQLLCLGINRPEFRAEQVKHKREIDETEIVPDSSDDETAEERLEELEKYEPKNEMEVANALMYTLDIVLREAKKDKASHSLLKKVSKSACDMDAYELYDLPLRCHLMDLTMQAEHIIEKMI